LQSASEMLELDLQLASGSKRIRPLDKEKRDMLIYRIWKTGRLSNHAIGSLLRITYWAVSKIVTDFNGRISKSKEL
jgi:hypothetical protein